MGAWKECMRRRDFITLLGAGAAAWPFAARAQQPGLPVLGFLGTSSADEWAPFVAAFRSGLKQAGYVEGDTVLIRYRWANGQYDRLPELAVDLVRQGVAVIFAAGSPAPALAAKAATRTIPIVFANGADPIQFGLVVSLNHPGGNITGLNFLVADLGEKELGLIHELVPNRAAAVIINPNNPNSASIEKSVSDSARLLRLQLHVLKAGTPEEIDTAFTELVARQLGALLVTADAFFLGRRTQFVTLADRYRIPALYYTREFVTAGGLMSYGTNISDAYHRAGVYTGEILKGARPADLPVQQSTRFEFVINLNTAKALQIEIPPGLLALADDAIE
jgi:ABC-type uncharacterized transport system substrate-binding protein